MQVEGVARLGPGAGSPGGGAGGGGGDGGGVRRRSGSEPAGGLMEAFCLSRGKSRSSPCLVGVPVLSFSSVVTLTTPLDSPAVSRHALFPTSLPIIS